ncbi:MAG: hypothetical protein COV34_03255, partial [Candidatus Zambryskibacteria bacterium CG10_big_fil_rev_8_21_14_0_10_42_12]
ATKQNPKVVKRLGQGKGRARTDSKIESVLGVNIDKAKIRILSPVVVGRKGEYYQMLYDMLGKGYEKAVIDGKEVSLRERIELVKHRKHDIDIVIDEIFLSEFKDDKKGTLERLAEAVEKALDESDGLVKIISPSTELGTETTRVVSAKFMCAYDGFSFPEVEPRLFSFNSPFGACEECKGLGTQHFFGNEPCPVCNGARLRPEALSVFLGGDGGRRVSKGQPTSKKADQSASSKGVNIVDLVSMSIDDAIDFFLELTLSKKEQEISNVVLKEITSRLEFMQNVGIGYLTLDRRANTLSGGEAQRIRLASQLGSGLVGALYVLDEPTIGLHQRDNDRLVKTLTKLRDLGNTIIVVEHDEDTIFAADYIVDIGPGAGVHGGEIVVADYLDKLLKMKTNPSGSETLAYLRGDKRIEIPGKRRTSDKGKLKIRGGKKFNIKNMSVDIPL